MHARIYLPSKSAMTSGMGNAREWVLDYVPAEARRIDPLMGWTSSADTKSQIRMSFATKKEAVAFATRHGIAFRLEEPQKTLLRPKSYAENFKFGRPDRWTH